MVTDEGSGGPEVKLFSDSLEMSCLVRCLACQKIITWEGFNRHLEKVHRNSKNVEYEFTRKTYHKCKICNCVMLLNLRKLQSHVVSRHQLSLQQYKDQHLGRTAAKHQQHHVLAVPADGGASSAKLPKPKTAATTKVSDKLSEVCRVLCVARS